MRETQIIIRIPHLPRRRWLALIAAGALAASAAAYAFAPFTLTNPKDGDTLSASLFAANNAAITAKVTELQNAIDKPVYKNSTTGKLYSINGSYCGVTPTTNGAITDGALTGNPATKSLCEKACAASPTAHMCTTLDVQRFVATGGTFPGTTTVRGWYASGLWTYDSATVVNDCAGWTSNLHTAMGPVSYATDTAHDDFCDRPFPILCCD